VAKTALDRWGGASVAWVGSLLKSNHSACSTP